MLAADGTLTGTTVYDSFGQNLSGFENSFNDRFGFAGREQISDLYFNRARTYSTSTGRFSSVDPIRFRGGTANLYSYTLNSPTNFTDPSGNITAVQYAVLGATSFAIGCTVRGFVDSPTQQTDIRVSGHPDDYDKVNERVREIENELFEKEMALLVRGAAGTAAWTGVAYASGFFGITAGLGSLALAGIGGVVVGGGGYLGYQVCGSDKQSLIVEEIPF